MESIQSAAKLLLAGGAGAEAVTPSVLRRVDDILLEYEALGTSAEGSGRCGEVEASFGCFTTIDDTYTLPHVCFLSSVRAPSVLPECLSVSGLLPEIGRAWSASGSRLHLWNMLTGKDLFVYDDEPAAITGVSCVLVPPKTFNPYVHRLLIVTTEVTVSVLGVTLEDNDTTSVFSLGYTVRSREPLGRMTQHLRSHRIFAGGLHEGCLYELVLSNFDGLIYSRFRLVNCSVYFGSIPFVSSVGELAGAIRRSWLRPNGRMVDIAVDQSSGVVFTLSSFNVIEAYSLAEHGQVMHRARTHHIMSDRSEQLIALRATYSGGQDGVCSMVAVSSRGERYTYVLSHGSLMGGVALSIEEVIAAPCDCGSSSPPPLSTTNNHSLICSESVCLVTDGAFAIFTEESNTLLLVAEPSILLQPHSSCRSVFTTETLAMRITDMTIVPRSVPTLLACNDVMSQFLVPPRLLALLDDSGMTHLLALLRPVDLLASVLSLSPSSSVNAHWIPLFDASYGKDATRAMIIALASGIVPTCDLHGETPISTTSPLDPQQLLQSKMRSMLTLPGGGPEVRTTASQLITNMRSHQVQQGEHSLRFSPLTLGADLLLAGAMSVIWSLPLFNASAFQTEGFAENGQSKEESRIIAQTLSLVRDALVSVSHSVDYLSDLGGGRSGGGHGDMESLYRSGIEWHPREVRRLTTTGPSTATNTTTAATVTVTGESNHWQSSFGNDVLNSWQCDVLQEVRRRVLGHLANQLHNLTGLALVGHALHNPSLLDKALEESELPPDFSLSTFVPIQHMKAAKQCARQLARLVAESHSGETQMTQRRPQHALVSVLGQECPLLFSRVDALAATRLTTHACDNPEAARWEWCATAEQVEQTLNEALPIVADMLASDMSGLSGNGEFRALCAALLDHGHYGPVLQLHLRAAAQCLAHPCYNSRDTTTTAIPKQTVRQAALEGAITALEEVWRDSNIFHSLLPRDEHQPLHNPQSTPNIIRTSSVWSMEPEDTSAHAVLIEWLLSPRSDRSASRQLRLCAIYSSSPIVESYLRSHATDSAWHRAAWATFLHRRLGDGLASLAHYIAAADSPLANIVVDERNIQRDEWLRDALAAAVSHPEATATVQDRQSLFAAQQLAFKLSRELKILSASGNRDPQLVKDLSLIEEELTGRGLVTGEKLWEFGAAYVAVGGIQVMLRVLYAFRVSDDSIYHDALTHAFTSCLEPTAPPASVQLDWICQVFDEQLPLSSLLLACWEASDSLPEPCASMLAQCETAPHSRLLTALIQMTTVSVEEQQRDGTRRRTDPILPSADLMIQWLAQLAYACLRIGLAPQFILPAAEHALILSQTLQESSTSSSSTMESLRQTRQILQQIAETLA